MRASRTFGRSIRPETIFKFKDGLKSVHFFAKPENVQIKKLSVDIHTSQKYFSELEHLFLLMKSLEVFSQGLQGDQVEFTDDSTVSFDLQNCSQAYPLGQS